MLTNDAMNVKIQSGDGSPSIIADCGASAVSAADVGPLPGF